MFKLPTPEEADRITPEEEKRIAEILPKLADHLTKNYHKGKTVYFTLGHVSDRVYDNITGELRKAGWYVNVTRDQREGVNLTLSSAKERAATTSSFYDR